MTIEDRITTPGTTVDFRELFRDLRATLMVGGADTLESLQAVVELVAQHFHSDVCSLYQLDERQNGLFLRATKGLRAEAVGRTVMQPGEGLVGTIAQTRRPLALEDAQADARFMFRPETGEEIYHSFMGVPLIRARSLLGVLVIQHRERRRYRPEEVEDCETVAQFLSEMLRQAAEDAPHEAPPARDTLRLPAVPLSRGLGVGKVVFALKDIVIRRWRVADPAPELDRVRAAFQVLEDSLADLPPDAADRETRELLEADLMLVQDKGWRERIEAAIGRGFSAEAAVQQVREDLRARMRAVANDYIRARLLDLDDLSHRLLTALSGREGRALSDLGPDTVLVCRSLGTAELLRIGRKGLAGLVVVEATPSSHIAIVANALKIPALGQAPAALTELREDDAVVLDAVNGQLIARPSPDVLAQYESHAAADRSRAAHDPWRSDQPCRSRDGVTVELLANAGLLLDLDEIDQLESVGVGLYRTEMAFLVRARMPSVEEQAALYRRILDRMAGRPVAFRTLDVGSDKALPYFEENLVEPNPALGWRAIRVGLDRPDLLGGQCRALLTAADGRALKVMFPMITEVEEFEAARALLSDELAAHVAGGGTAPRKLDVGVMIEVPALLWDLDRLFQAVDFASVGTNDLFQFLNASDRNNPKTDQRFDPFKPANLRLLAGIAAAAERHGKPVGVCGELAGEPLGALALIGCGFRSLSMNAANLPRIKSVVRALNVAGLKDEIERHAARTGGSLREEIAALARDQGAYLD